MTIGVSIEGLDELIVKFSQLGADIDVAIEDAIEDVAIGVRNEVVGRIQKGPASGRVYEKYRPRRTHQASAPGQAPMTDTGRLVSSVYLDIKGKIATVGSKLAYARALEYGTRNMAARPVWTPAAERARKKLVEAMARELNKAIEK